MIDSHCGLFLQHQAHTWADDQRQCDGAARPLEIGELAVQRFTDRPAAGFVYSQPDLLLPGTASVGLYREARLPAQLDGPPHIVVEEFDTTGARLREQRLPDDHILVRALLAEETTTSNRTSR